MVTVKAAGWPVMQIPQSCGTMLKGIVTFIVLLRCLSDVGCRDGLLLNSRLY